MAQPKKQNNSPETDTKEMQIFELPDKEFKTVALKMLSDAKRKHREVNEIRKMLYVQKW